MLSLISGEGSVLPYVIFEIYLRLPVSGGNTRFEQMQRGAVFTPQYESLTKGWDVSFKQGLLKLRTDLLPETRDLLPQLTEAITAGAHLVALELREGVHMYYFVTAGITERRIAAEFLECVDDIHRNVLKLPPGLN